MSVQLSVRQRHISLGASSRVQDRSSKHFKFKQELVLAVKPLNIKKLESPYLAYMLAQDVKAGPIERPREGYDLAGVFIPGLDSENRPSFWRIGERR